MTALRAYAAQTHDRSVVADRVQDHMALVRKIAWQVHGRARDLFEVEDLVQIGMMTLVEAAQRFQDVGQASFTVYAALRIRGALTDHLRKHLSLTRLGVQRRDQILRAEQAVKEAGGDPTDPRLVAAALGLDAQELQAWKQHVAITRSQSLEEVYDDHSIWFADESETAEKLLLAEEMRAQLRKHLARLKEREALVLQLYFVEELNLEEIAEILEVTVGRVSQIKKAALTQLRRWMQDA